MKIQNFVAKHMNAVNKSAVHKNKKALARLPRKTKHKGRSFD